MFNIIARLFGVKPTENIQKVQQMGNLKEAKELSAKLRQNVLNSNASIAQFHDRVNEIKAIEDRAIKLSRSSKR